MPTPAPPPPGPAFEPGLLQQIAARGRVRRYPAHAVLLNEGDDGQALYILLSGRVKVVAADDAGRQVTIALRGPGETVGEMALDGAARSASVVTLEPTACAVVGPAELQPFIAEHPDFALHLVFALIGRIRELTASTTSLALDDVAGRVAAFLERSSAVGPDGTRTVAERLTHAEIAQRTGTSRERVSRVFGALKAGGCIAVSGGRITLLKPLPRRE